LHINELCSTMK